MFKAITNGTFKPPPPAAQPLNAKGKPRNIKPRKYARAPSTANHVMIHLHAIIEFIREKFRDDIRGRYLILGYNPVDAMRRLRKPNPVRCRKGRIPTDRLRAAWQALKRMGREARSRVERCAADWNRFRLLTGTRASESSKTRFSYVDFANNLIILPGSITKNGQPLPIPMSAQLRELMLHRLAVHVAEHGGQALPDDWVFPSPRSASGHITESRKTLKSIATLVAFPQLQGHDLRRTFVDVCNELGFEELLRKRLLNHKLAVLGANYDNNPRLVVNALRRIGEWYESPEAVEEMPLTAPDDAALCTHDDVTPEAVQAVALVASEPPAATMAPAALAAATTDRLRAWRELDPRKLAWDVWERPTLEIAKAYHVSDVAVGKRCKVLGIPKPPPTYWNKVHAGKIPKQAAPRWTLPLAA